jgi:K+-sensing histidine kinase KdpD
MAEIFRSTDYSSEAVGSKFIYPANVLAFHWKDIMKKKSSSWVWGILSFAVVLALGMIDWFTGYELNFFVFYFLPVAIAAWLFGLTGAVALATFSAMVWFGADYLTGHTHSLSAYAVWNTMIRLISFLAIGWSVARLSRLIDRERQTAEILRRSLSEIKVLETFLPICAQCKKIRDEQGVWHQLEAYISDHSKTKFSHSYCPERYKKTLAEAGLLDK